MTEQIVSKLDRLAELASERDVLNVKKQELVDSILTQEIRDKLAEIDAEFATSFSAVGEKYTALEGEIKDAVKELGESVKGQFLHAVWAKGRVSWDTKALDGYAAAHPELLDFRKEGDPSVSIRVSK